MRLRQTDFGVVLEAATDQYVRSDGRLVWLVGAVHVAEPVLYEVASATLASADAVWVEGIADDLWPAPEPDRAASLGLVSQAAWPRGGDWLTVDPPESEIAGWMRADGVSEADVRRLLGPAPALHSEAKDARRLSIQRLMWARSLVRFTADPIGQTYLIDRRDDRVAEALLHAPQGSVAAWYGAAHLDGIGRRLVGAGLALQERRWVPVVSIGYADLELGPVQVQQLLRATSP